MGVPTSGSFSMFGNSDNTTIQGAITEGGGSVASVDNLNDLIAASNVSLFDTSFSGDLSGSLSNVTNANQYRGYPASVASTAFAFTYTFPAGQTYNARVNLDDSTFIGGTYNATWTWGDGATTSINQSGGFGVNITRTIADNSGGGSTSTYNGNLVAASTTSFNSFDIDPGFSGNFNITDITAWGNIKWSALKFKGASTSLNISASDTPDLSRCTSFNQCFDGLTNFNDSNIVGWDVSNVTTFNFMFRGSTAFNQNLNGWDTSSVTILQGVFENCTSFNQSCNSWDVSNVTLMNGMFKGATSFNQDLNSWDTSEVTQMQEMFEDATAFNGNITSWNVTKVQRMDDMFEDATSFNQNIGSWDTQVCTKMQSMFRGATSFNQDISSWDTADVTNMSRMFLNANAFNQNLASWDIADVTDMTSMFEGTALSDANYKATIIGWAAQSTQSNVTAHFGSAQLTDTAGQNARTTLVSRGWTITDGDGTHT